MSGYLQLPRSLFRSKFWSERREFSKAEAMFDLYRRAMISETKTSFNGKIVPLQKGQLVASIRQLQVDWSWSTPRKVHHFLQSLAEEGTISISEFKGATIITACYSAFCDPKTERNTFGTPIGTLSEHLNASLSIDNKAERNEIGTHSGTLSEHPIVYSKKKKEKKEREETPTPFEVRQQPILPGTPEFELLKRVGGAAAIIWIQSGASEKFASPEHAALALDWMQYCSDRGKPFRSHMELTALMAIFETTDAARLGRMVQYSVNGKWTNLYPDFDAPRGAGRKRENAHLISANDAEDIFRELSSDGL